MGQGGDAFVADSAVVYGMASLGAGSSVWHGAVVRADEDTVTIGAETNIQDNAVVHVTAGHPVTLGRGVTVGHAAIVHGCTVGDHSLIGMGAIILDGAQIGSNCIVGAGALVPQGRVVPDGTVVFGSPARVIRHTSEEDEAHIRANALRYSQKAARMLPSVSAVSPINDQQVREDLREEQALTLRRAQERDIPGIEKLLRQVCQMHADGRPDLFRSGGTKYTADELRELISFDERPIFVAVDEDDDVLGYAFCMFEDYTNDTARTPIRTLYIDDICVDEAARGRHVGTAVYNHVIAFAREQGFYNVTLNVWSCNPGAQRFYEAMGMQPYKTALEQVL